MNFLRTNICLVPFWHILFICSAHLSLLDMVTPKCLWLSTWFKLSELNFRFIGFMFCPNEITIYSVCWRLKSTIHCFAQLSKTCRSKFNLSSTSNGLVDEIIKDLSSANNLTRLWISSAISFIKSKNSNVPSYPVSPFVLLEIPNVHPNSTFWTIWLFIINDLSMYLQLESPHITIMQHTYNIYRGRTISKLWMRWLWKTGIQRTFLHQRNACWNLSTEFLADVSNALVLWRLFVGEFNRKKYSMLFNVYSSIKPLELVYYVLLGIFSHLCW